MLLPALTHRQRRPELMDRDDIDPAILRRSLAFIRFVNRYLGYTRATLHHLARFAQTWPAGQTIRIIDLATGSADIPRAILRWADRTRHDVRITAVDRHALTARLAAERSHDPRLSIVQADVFNLPFAAQSFDYAITAMFLHHLDDGQIVEVLRTMDRLARRGIIAADLLRHRRAYAWIRLLTLPCNRVVRHDAPVSIAQALSHDEVLLARDAAGLTYADYHQHFGHRWILAGERE